MTRWGVVATIKAPASDVLNFVAHHIELGADHLWIYLDARNHRAQAELQAHPQVTVTRTDDAYWQASGKNRPKKHQLRQVRNASHAYAQANALDWLLHIDVDEFLWPQHSVSDMLAALPDSCLSARVRPSEAMSSDGVLDAEPGLIWFKRWISGKHGRREVSRVLYPTYGDYVKGGFVSHVAGKVFARTGYPDMSLRIHKAVLGKDENPTQIALEQAELLHLHITDWAHWQKSFDYRHEKGSYRAELRAALPKHGVGMTLHQLFATLSQEPGGLRDFFEEVCLATPELRAKLDARGLLRAYRLELEAKRKRQFPDFTK